MKFIFLLGERGSGKSLVSRELTHFSKGVIHEVLKTTTRPQRRTDSVHSEYIFVSNQEFEDDIKNNRLAFFTHYYQNFYGIRNAEIIKVFEQGTQGVVVPWAVL